MYMYVYMYMRRNLLGDAGDEVPMLHIYIYI